MKTKLILIVCCFPILCSGQNINIIGRIVTRVDNLIEPIGFATVTLMKNDSTIIAGAACDGDGNFLVSKIQKGDYILSVSFMGYKSLKIELKNITGLINLNDIEITQSSILLEEVTVSASGIITKLDRKIIFPSQAQIKKSSDGVELLRNLHLNGIDIKRSDNSISGARGGSVKLRINGANADIKEILAIDPKYVVRVEYHDEPSLRYGNAEAVVDYIVRRQESGGAVMMYANNSPTNEWGEEYISTKFNHKKSEWLFMYGFNYRGFEAYQNNKEIFNFLDGNSLTRIEEGYSGTFRSREHSLRTSYSLLEPEKYLFLVTLNYNKYSKPKNNLTSFLYSEGNKDDGVQMLDLGKSQTQTPSINLYYQYNLKKDQLLVFDVVGTYLDIESKRNYTETQNGVKLTDIVSNITGKKYSIIGEGIYEKIFKPGRLSIGVKHSQNFSKNEYDGSIDAKTDMQQSYTNFYTEWLGKMNRFMYGIGVGGGYTKIKQESINHDDLQFTPTLRLGYQFNDNVELRYRGEIMLQSPSLGDLNDVMQAIDSLQIRRGNPNLYPYKSYLNRITFSFNKKKLRLNIDVSDHYSINPIMEGTFQEGSKFIHMMDNQRSWHNIRTTANIAFSLKNLYIYTRGGLNWIDSKGQNYRHVLQNWFISSGIDGSWKNWSAFGEIKTGTKNLVGETISEGENTAAVGLGYRWNNLYLNSYMLCNIGSWTNAYTDLNQYASSQKHYYLPESNTFLVIKASWSFEFGRRYKSGNKKVSNSDNDTGIINVKK